MAHPVVQLHDAHLWCSFDTPNDGKTQASEPEYMTRGPLTLWDVSHAMKAQVGDIFWTLSKEVASVRINKTTFSFSVPESPGLYLTVILPQDISADQLDLLSSVLSSVTNYHGETGMSKIVPLAATTDNLPVTTQGQDKAARIAQAGTAAGNFVRAAAAFASVGLTKGAELIVKNVKPGAPITVSEKTQKNLEGLRAASASAAAMAGRVSSNIAKATEVAGAHLAVTVQKSGALDQVKKMANKSGVDTQQAGPVMGAVVSALDEVFQAMEDAGLMIAKSFSSATSQVVHHRYGASAAAATQAGLGAAVHVVEARRNLSALRPTRIVKNTIKATAGNMVPPRPGHNALPGSSGVVIEELPPTPLALPAPTTHVPPPVYPAPAAFPAVTASYMPAGGLAGAAAQRQSAEAHLAAVGATQAAGYYPAVPRV